MPLLSNGQYRIFNAGFTTQDVDLLFGQPNSVIGGYVNNTNTLNMVWNLKNVGDGVDEFTLTNVAPSANQAYAFVDQHIVGTRIGGSPHATIWTLMPTEDAGQYWILSPSSYPSQLAWSLASGQNLAPITLQPIALNNLSQVWTFEPQAGTAGNTTKGLNDLD